MTHIECKALGENLGPSALTSANQDNFPHTVRDVNEPLVCVCAHIDNIRADISVKGENEERMVLNLRISREMPVPQFLSQI